MSYIDNSEAGSVYKVIEQLEQKLYHSSSIPLLHTREKLLKVYSSLCGSNNSCGYSVYLVVWLYE
jgi:SET and MYND domain-containing protein